MSWARVFAGFVRGVLIASATAATAFGLLVVFHPFANPASPEVSVATSSPGTRALEGRIEALRISLRETEAARGRLQDQSLSITTSPDAGLRAQYEAQIAAAIERRDLAMRHAKTIRDALAAGVPVSSFAEIRDSVVIGQLLSQQASLDAQIALEGARLRANHPTMRALNAQRASLAGQIGLEAANIAAALESEAKLEDAQIALLESQLPAPSPEAAPVDTAALDAKASAQRAELDNLVDAYFNIPTAAAPAASIASNMLSLANLVVVAIAGLAAIVFQIALAFRRRRPSSTEADLAEWQEDADPEVTPVAQPEPLRKAS